MLDALQSGDRILDLARDLGFQLGGRSPRPCGADRHGRQIDVRKILDLHGVESHESGQGQHHEQQDARNRVTDGPGRDVHRATIPLCVVGQAMLGRGQRWSACCTSIAYRLAAAGASTTRTVSPSARKETPAVTRRAPASSPPTISTRSPTRRPVSTLVNTTFWSAPMR